ncbi:MAG TPA: ABC transporter substrate-binding protein [Bacteroidetes bacterium]|nr:ABC transporter substrate-binding protein [Bacteroidota bacterium]
MKKQLLTGCVVSLLLLSGCMQKYEDTGILRIATLKGPSAISMAPLIRNSRNDSTVHYLLFDEPLRVRALMLREEVDIAVLPSTTGALLYNRGVPYRIVAVPVWGNLYMLGPSGEQWSWKKAAEKRIFLMARGMTPDILFRYLAVRNGVDPERDLNLDYSYPTHTDLAQALAAGKATYGVMGEPYVSMILEKNPGLDRILDLNTAWEGMWEDNLAMPQTAILVHNGFAEAYPERLEKFLEEYARAIEWINAFPEAAGYLSDSLGIMKGPETVARSIPWSNIRFRRAGEVKHALVDYYRIFYEFDPRILGEKMPDESFIYEK